MSYTTNGHLFF